MITLKKFAMAVMLLAGFQQVSADVCKLKVKDAVKRAVINYGEVWVDRDNGEIYKIPEDSNFLTNIVGETKFKGDVSRLCHIIKRSVEAFEGGTVKGAYRDAIFCSDEHDKEDEVVINVDGANNRQEEAKRQFENIIKCGLLEGTRFNEKIYVNNFTDRNWGMPGISAFVKNNVEAGSDNQVNVYCAMKTKCEGKNMFWQVNNYLHDIPAAQNNGGRYFYSYEHTERQLVVNHMLDGKLAKDTAEYQQDKNLLNGVQYDCKHPLTNGNLFVWTRGNPCPSPSDDNGGFCCMQWYKDTYDVLGISSYIYFSKIESSLVNEGIDSSIKSMLLKAKNELSDILAITNEILNKLRSEHSRIDETYNTKLCEKKQLQTDSMDDDAIEKSKRLAQEMKYLKTAVKNTECEIKNYTSYINSINNVLSGGQDVKDVNTIIGYMQQLLYSKPINEMFNNIHPNLSIYYKTISTGK